MHYGSINCAPCKVCNAYMGQSAGLHVKCGIHMGQSAGLHAKCAMHMGQSVGLHVKCAMHMGQSVGLHVKCTKLGPDHGKTPCDAQVTCCCPLQVPPTQEHRSALSAFVWAQASV